MYENSNPVFDLEATEEIDKVMRYLEQEHVEIVGVNGSSGGLIVSDLRHRKVTVV